MNSAEFSTFLKAVLPDMGFNWRRFDRRNIRRKVRRRMESVGIHEALKYADLVNSDPAERAVLDALLRVTITRFFRNAWLWEEMGPLLSRNLPGASRGLTAWSAGCAGGEEAFSLAMLLDNLAGKGLIGENWTVLGSDIDPPSLERAREATYQWGTVREVPSDLLKRWFTQEGDEWHLDDQVRKMVTILPHDLVKEEPPGRFDLVLLRNSVLTYNTKPVQRQVLQRIRDHLDPSGLLVIGRTEKLPEGTGFEKISKCIYQKVE
jgi:chemotaxis protein methyltransferase CheR